MGLETESSINTCAKAQRRRWQGVKYLKLCGFAHYKNRSCVFATSHLEAPDAQPDSLSLQAVCPRSHECNVKLECATCMQFVFLNCTLLRIESLYACLLSFAAPRPWLIWFAVTSTFAATLG